MADTTISAAQIKTIRRFIFENKPEDMLQYVVENVVGVSDNGLLLSASLYHRQPGTSVSGELLLVAASLARFECAKILISQLGANAGYRNRVGRTALHAAAVTGQLELMRFLLEGPYASSVAVDAVTSDGHTPLSKAARRGHLDCVECLLQHGASVWSIKPEPAKGGVAAKEASTAIADGNDAAEDVE